MAWDTLKLALLFNKENIVPFSKFVRKVFKTRSPYFPIEEQAENLETTDREGQEQGNTLFSQLIVQCQLI